MNLEGVAELTRLGYDACTHLLLSYSAAEAFGKACGARITQWTLDDEALAKRLRPLIQCTDAGMTVLPLTQSLNRQLQTFHQGDSHNVRIPATAMRHWMAHGELTPTTIKLNTKARCQALNELAAVLLNQAACNFNAWAAAKVKGNTLAKR